MTITNANPSAVLNANPKANGTRNANGNGNSKTKLGIYYTLGDGGMDESVAILEAALEGGAKLLEVGLPFSDPLLDGPVIQQSHTRALKNGEIPWAKMCGALERLVKSAHQKGAQVSVMTSVQLLFSESQRAALPAVDGILVTDIKATKAAPVPLPSPRVWFVSGELASQPGISMPAGEKFSMIYLTRLQGVTGEGQKEDAQLGHSIECLRKISKAPIWLGFGISTAEDVLAAIERGADGAIVGSAFVKQVQAAATGDRVKAAQTFVEALLNI